MRLTARSSGVRLLDVASLCLLATAHLRTGDAAPPPLDGRRAGPALVDSRSPARARGSDAPASAPQAHHAGRSFPNAARFYTKIGGEADFWDASTSEVRSDLVRYNDLIFVGEPQGRTEAISADLRARMDPAGDDVILLRYWNLWGAYGGKEAHYTDDMFLYRNWPQTDSATRGPRIVNAERGHCTRLKLVDASKPALLDEVARVVSTFLDEFDGVYFDMSSWEIYSRQYELGSVGMVEGEGEGCVLPPFALPNAFVEDFLPASGDHILAYHRRMQSVIDPGGDGRKLHFCNAVPRATQRKHDSFEEVFLEVVDGCQMDTAFINQTGRAYTRANWRFHLETMRRYIGKRKYFLAKIPWSHFDDPRRTDSLEYGFASYLLGADGRYALFMPAWNFHAWAGDPIVSAPIGDPVGEAAGAARGKGAEWVLTRAFERGLVVVNADRKAHTIELPDGASFRDARRGGSVSGSLELPAASARILVQS